MKVLSTIRPGKAHDTVPFPFLQFDAPYQAEVDERSAVLAWYFDEMFFHIQTSSHKRDAVDAPPTYLTGRSALPPFSSHL